MRRLIAFSFSVWLLPGLPALAQQDVITTLIGGGPNNMPAIDADISPVSVALDGAGNYYIASYSQYRVFKVNSSGALTVFAGTGVSGYGGDGVPGGAADALLGEPSAVALDSAGNVYIGDNDNCVVRKVDATNTITTIAGVAGQCGYNGDGSPATNYLLRNAEGLALDNSGNLYIADSGNCLIWKLVLSTSTIGTIAGFYKLCGYAGDGGAATSAELNSPGGVAVDGAGNVYIADTENYRIREVSSSTGNITTIAGNGTRGFSGGGPATSAEIGYVDNGVWVNAAGAAVLVADSQNNVIWQFTVGGNIYTIAGSTTGGFCGDGGPAASACLNGPTGIAVSSAGSIYVADTDNNRIRQFTPGGDIQTVAGNGSFKLPTQVTGIPAQGVVFNYPWGVLVGHSGNILVSDQKSCLVQELVQSTGLVDFFAGEGVCGYGGDGEKATRAKLRQTLGLAHDSSGNIYISDEGNCIVRQVNSSGIISTFAGTPKKCGNAGDGGTASAAELSAPAGLFVDSQDSLYIADQGDNVVRKVAGGIITTFAGTGVAGSSGDGGPATAAELNAPSGVTGDGAGNIYIADTSNCRIREVSGLGGVINTVAGVGLCGFSGDGPATMERLHYPQGVLVDASGNLFIADTYNNRLRWVDTVGAMHTFAGTGYGGYSGDGGAATNADLNRPTGIAQDSTGNFLVSDSYNFRVRSISSFARLNVSARALAFGLVTIGSSSQPQTVTLTAVGEVSVGAISTSGDFTEFDDCGSSLSDGQTCTIYVYFAPTASGARTGTLTIGDSGYFNVVTTIGLSGTGSAVSIQGSPVAFGNQLVQTTSAPKEVTVTNVGATAITMYAITLDETTDFAISSNTCPASGQTLAAKAVCVIGLTFTPQTTGAKKGTLTIGGSDASSPQIVGLSGTGTSR